jgi:hypothetical protein
MSAIAVATLDPSWAAVPVIISDNKDKDAINKKAAVVFAKQSGQELHWYYVNSQKMPEEK